jgi:hypothetical protein
MYVAQPYRGFGAAATAIKSVQAGTAIGAPVVAAAGATSVAAILGVSTAVAIPLIGAAIVGIAALATYLISNSGCGKTCIETSQWANQVEALLGQNIATYFAEPAPRTLNQQAAALAIFDSIWARLVQMCSDPSTGNAGKRCISDRQAGSCAYHQTADKVPPWGTPPAGACWNWFAGYRDPIEQDPNVYDDSVGATVDTVSASVSAALASTGLSTPALIGLAAAAALGIWAVTS